MAETDRLVWSETTDAIKPDDSAAHGAIMRAAAPGMEITSVPLMDVRAEMSSDCNATFPVTFKLPSIVFRAPRLTLDIASLCVIFKPPEPTIVSRGALKLVMSDPAAVLETYKPPPIDASDLKS